MGILSLARFGLPGAVIALLVDEAQAVGGGRLALVGGAVRDLLLYRDHREPWRELPDLDFVWEGSCCVLAERLREHLGAERVTELHLHQQFGTAELLLDGVRLDLASARTEIYPEPGENPVVQPGGIEQDLASRDFTVNAMAFLLSADGSPSLVDPHGGRVHLETRQLAFLHDTSVEDDPTRILRGARYCARLGFDLAPDALAQIQATIARWPWGWRPGDPADAVPPALGTRLRMELELLLDREPWQNALQHLRRCSGMALLDDALQQDDRLHRRLHQDSRLGLPLLPCLVAAACDPSSLALRLQIPRQQQIWIAELIDLRCWLADRVQQQDWRTWGALEWTKRLERRRCATEVVALAVLDHTEFRRPLLRWWGRWRHVTATLRARDLIDQGFQPGPELGEALRRSRDQALQAMR